MLCLYLCTGWGIGVWDNCLTPYCECTNDLIVESTVMVYIYRLLATTSADQSVRVWKTTDFTLQTTLSDPMQRWVWDCAFSSDSQYVITGKRPYSY